MIAPSHALEPSLTGPSCFPERATLVGPLSRKRQNRTISVYAIVFFSVLGLLASRHSAFLDAMALGLMVPGAGFLAWTEAGAGLNGFVIYLFVASLFVFAVAIVIWFATGNIALPILVWLVLAVASGLLSEEDAGRAWQVPTIAVPLCVITAFARAWGASFWSGRCDLEARRKCEDRLDVVGAKRSSQEIVFPAKIEELNLVDLQRLRLLYDRALQPVEAFDGFEWLDQFQTAAVRYQINFVSYALSVAQSVHFPAFHGYAHAAQENLVAKQLDHRIWRYWQLENIWGHFRTGADPIPRGNIMFSGFVAAQAAYYHGASGKRSFDASGSLVFEHPSGTAFSYSLRSITDALVQQYRESSLELLACEPNWVYPLCNALTATAIRAGDASYGAAHWERIAPLFRHHLETEFIDAAGRFIPFRSSVTGFAAPQIGGAVVQAFPCLFLNSILPDIAARQWSLLRDDLIGPNSKRRLWPVDIGNYGLFRASSYTATAATAVEMGDMDVARHRLAQLDEDCPPMFVGGVPHRPNASVWSHALEVMVRCGRQNALRLIVERPRRPSRHAPFIKDARYPDVLVAQAFNAGEMLHAVFYPDRPGEKNITIGGLRPGQSYVAKARNDDHFIACTSGEASIGIFLDGRTELRIVRAV